MKKHVLFIMSGSISCYKACEAIAQLRRKYSVQVVMTQSALQFVGTTTPEALTGLPVLTNTFGEGKALDHINEVRKADLIVVAPATANIIAKMANGIADDLASTMLVAHDYQKPLLVAPAMNTKMWDNPATKENVAKLKQRGIIFLDPVEGVLACGEEGKGKLVQPERIASTVAKHLTVQKNIKVLITSGGTQEAIDDVRVLTNKSSGKTGAVIADYLSNEGYEIVYLGAKHGIKPKSEYIKQENFKSFNELNSNLEQLLSKNYFDYVIHAAAVSDFSVKPAEGKLSSDSVPQLEFTKNPKIVDSIKNYSKNKKVKVFAFKLTSKSSKVQQMEAVYKLLSHAPVDFVVVNDISQIKENIHPSEIFSKNREFIASADSKEGMAKIIAKCIEKDRDEKK